MDEAEQLGNGAGSAAVTVWTVPELMGTLLELLIPHISELGTGQLAMVLASIARSEGTAF